MQHIVAGCAVLSMTTKRDSFENGMQIPPAKFRIEMVLILVEKRSRSFAFTGIIVDADAIAQRDIAVEGIRRSVFEEMGEQPHRKKPIECRLLLSLRWKTRVTPQ